jgi:hypothetical protein
VKEHHDRRLDEPAPTFADAIHEHLELRRRNAALEFEMPLANYLPAQRADDEETHEDADTLTGLVSSGKWSEQ